MLLSRLLLTVATAVSALAKANAYQTQPDPPTWINSLPQRNYTLILQDGTTSVSCNLQPGAVLINGDGELLSFGGTVMKNVAGFDVSRVLAGSMGQLGLITEVTLKVLPLPAATATLVRRLHGT